MPSSFWSAYTHSPSSCPQAFFLPSLPLHHGVTDIYHHPGGAEGCAKGVRERAGAEAQEV